MVDLQNLKQPCTQSMEQYYDKFSIGIVTGKGRTPWAARLIRQLKLICPTIPISIVVNTYDSEDSQTIGGVVDGSIWSEAIRQLPWCKNQNALMYPDRPYIIWLNDDMVVAHDRAIDTLIWTHLEYGVDFVRGGVNNGCISMFKGTFAQVGWWDERYWYNWEDCDFHFRLAIHKVKTARYSSGRIFGHNHCTIGSYTGEHCNGAQVHKKKWGLDVSEPPVYPTQALLPEIDYYPYFTELFKKMERIS